MEQTPGSEISIEYNKIADMMIAEKYERTEKREWVSLKTEREPQEIVSGQQHDRKHTYAFRKRKRPPQGRPGDQEEGKPVGDAEPSSSGVIKSHPAVHISERKWSPSPERALCRRQNLPG